MFRQILDPSELAEFIPLLDHTCSGFDDSSDAILADCASGTASAWVSDEGIVVLERCPDNTLFIRVAAGRVNPTRFGDRLADVEALARSLGATRVGFKSHRKGFERTLSEGWKIHHVVWYKEV